MRKVAGESVETLQELFVSKKIINWNFWEKFVSRNNHNILIYFANVFRKCDNVTFKMNSIIKFSAGKVTKHVTEAFYFIRKHWKNKMKISDTLLFKIYYAFGYSNIIVLSFNGGKTIESQYLIGFGRQANWLEGIHNIFN